MAIHLKVQSGRKNRNRKEIYFSLPELHLIQFAQLYYSVDFTTTMRVLLRTAIIELIAKAKRDGVPKITAEMQRLIDAGGL